MIIFGGGIMYNQLFTIIISIGFGVVAAVFHWLGYRKGLSHGKFLGKMEVYQRGSK